ncbi:MAG: flagellar protein FlgN [gamma proteobacterium symbiont of Taylorina sp.]|nr:flagellar protein FlgN [gamma proteobacterium symbiont of Taylorina sp.]
MTPFLSTTQANTIEKNNFSSDALLHSILQQEYNCLNQILQILCEENIAIVNRETNVMGSLLDKKTHLLSKLDQLDKQRQHFFEQASEQPYNTQGFSLFIQQQTSEELITLWQEIKIQLSQCRKQNEISGRVINIRKENTEQILQLLLGRPANNLQTYSHLGQTAQQKRSALYTSV